MTALVRVVLREDGFEDVIEYGLLTSFVASAVLATLILDPMGVRHALLGAYQSAVDVLYLAARGDLGRL